MNFFPYRNMIVSCVILFMFSHSLYDFFLRFINMDEILNQLFHSLGFRFSFKKQMFLFVF